MSLIVQYHIDGTRVAYVVAERGFGDRLGRHIVERRRMSDNSVRGGSSDSVPVSQKVLNVSIPDVVYWHIRRCAADSRMSVKAYMAAFCQTAKPIVTAPAAAALPQ